MAAKLTAVQRAVIRHIDTIFWDTAEQVAVRTQSRTARGCTVVLNRLVAKGLVDTHRFHTGKMGYRLTQEGAKARREATT